MFLFCAVVATGITPSVLGMIFFGLATVVLGNNEVDS
jgi:hypothetical protein